MRVAAEATPSSGRSLLLPVFLTLAAAIPAPISAAASPLAQVWSTSGTGSFGGSVASADVNGDGRSDLIVGAYTTKNLVGDEVGAVFAYYGSPTGVPTAPDWSVEGADIGGWFGISVSSAGDVNGDGWDDVIIGASEVGKVFVFYGSPNGLPSTPSWEAESGLNRPGNTGDQFS